MIFSRYIRRFNYNDQIFLFNYLNSSLICINDELDKLLNELTCVDLLFDIHPDLYHTLKDELFIINSSEDDYINCKNEIINHLSEPEVLRITINPTMDCNCKCWYCYEDHLSNSIISDALLSGIFKFITNEIQAYGFKKLSLSFFGGEPLLCKDKIIITISRLHKLCQDNNIEFNLQITTNGILLNNDFFSYLKKLKIDCIFQIAFDGNKRFHNTTKNCNQVSDVYTTVLSNINEGLRHKFIFAIRFNFSDKSIDSFYSVVDDIKSLSSYDRNLLSISLQKIWQVKENDNLILKYNSLRSYIGEATVETLSTTSNGLISHCYGSYLHSYVFNYNGDIYKCTARKFLKESRIGYINSNGDVTYIDSPINVLNTRFKEACRYCSIFHYVKFAIRFIRKMIIPTIVRSI